MNRDELKSAFDRQATSYDEQWARMSPINDAMFLLLDKAFSTLPNNARVLCVGVGTGTELLHFTQTFPEWRFTVVEPSRSMMDVCHRRLDQAGVSDRCTLHEGYLESLPVGEAYDAATCFLVSQFILDAQERAEFFGQIAARMVPGGLLADSDLSADVASPEYDDILAVWQRVMSGSEASADGLERMRASYAKDVAVLPPGEVASIIESGGFERPVHFFQAGLIHAWFARRAHIRP